MSVKLYILGVLKIGYNQFLITDKTGNTSELKYPEVSFKFQVDIEDDDKEDTTEKEECEDPWKGNIVISCE